MTGRAWPRRPRSWPPPRRDAGLTKQRSGGMVDIRLVVGVMGNAGAANYEASKAAVIGLTKAGDREYASRGITVNAVAAGFIEAAMTEKVSGEVREALLKQ